MLPPQQVVDIYHADGRFCRLEEARATLHRFSHEAMGGTSGHTSTSHARARTQ